jgi:hypothetical protein
MVEVPSFQIYEEYLALRNVAWSIASVLEACWDVLWHQLLPLGSEEWLRGFTDLHRLELEPLSLHRK